MAGLIVTYGVKIKKEILNFPERDLDIIAEFIEHLKQHGFIGLVGRNKSSDNVPTDDPLWSEKVAYAQKHNLWYYHIGIPQYELTDKGDKVSEYIVHYIRGDNTVKIVDFNRHPPFRLPSTDYLH